MHSVWGGGGSELYSKMTVLRVDIGQVAELLYGDNFRQPAIKLGVNK